MSICGLLSSNQVSPNSPLHHIQVRRYHLPASRSKQSDPTTNFLARPCLQLLQPNPPATLAHQLFAATNQADIQIPLKKLAAFVHSLHASPITTPKTLHFLA